ncbi:hypothetical protein P6F26_15255 [Roseibacterium sp. SDUM158017]|uniref:head-tail connector protein n=1 Tax=Roseicyclus salinarum TaxID=3036773 RepID=UPI0024155625|nr:hypothetical protein [Roseibacterium sp. SDUM158017]MDG4649801.1 hypothetical protein [Roseibacterium sp. SDUM158017]
MLTEIAPVPGAALPVEDLAGHLRLSRGFADDAALDTHLEGCLRSALAAIETRLAKALFRRQFSLSAANWAAQDSHPLSVAPVVSVETFKIISRTGEETLVAPEAYDLDADAHRPALVARSGRLPVLPPGSAAEIRFHAGFSEDWAGLPPDLRQAVVLLAAEFFGQNAEADRGWPASVSVLLEPFRVLRLRGAGR